VAERDFHRHIQEMPEPKLEFLDGRLVVGNGAGNLRLLHHLLEGWGPEAALPMAPERAWWEALAEGFATFAPPSPAKPPGVWQAWAAQLSYTPDVPVAGPMVEGKHRSARQRLTMSLFRGGFAHVSGRDVVMRLGEDAVTPDVWAVGPQSEGLLNEHYLDGPADWVIGVLLLGHERYDREVKRHLYEAGGVGEYWLVDPARREVDCLRLHLGEYRRVQPDPQGVYRPAAFPRLAFRPALLWEGDDWGRGPDPFHVEGPMPEVAKGYAEGGVSWGDVPFDPQPALGPGRMTFTQFLSWAPEAKFELIDGKPWVGGSRGSRNVLGMILRTEGLAKSVTVLHPSAWVKALVQQAQERETDAARKQQAWQVARRAADFLRERFGYGRVVVIGDLVRPQPLDVWSLIHLVAFDPPKQDNGWETYRLLSEQFPDEERIELTDFKRLSKSEKENVDAEGVEV
jgi:hypothetical protein